MDDLLLAGPDTDDCLRFGTPTDRGTLRRLVAERQLRLRAAGLTPDGTAALSMGPSLEFVVTLLAGWREGAQVALLDHRLSAAETAAALDRLAPQVLVEDGPTPPGAALRGYVEAPVVVTGRPGGRPAAGEHRLIQLSSGSTGPSKVIARTGADLAAELDRYARMPDFPRRGGRVVLLSSMVHVLGLVGGLLHALHAGAELVLPVRLTGDGILDAVRAGERPTTVIGVPFHAQLLTAIAQPPPTPSLVRMIVAGELVRPAVPQAFRERYGVPLGTMYGMTELGVIATDLDGTAHPALTPAHGHELIVRDGELHIRRPDNPYLGTVAADRWSDGWLHTRDAAEIDPDTGRVVVLGRRDSQVSVGGLKVDLNEVEQTLREVPGVTECVLVFDNGAIRAYAELDATTSPQEARGRLAARIAGYKVPRTLRALPRLPRTNTGKLLRSAEALRAAGEQMAPSA
ncbi:fatty acid--CoA ligase family protein [Streptomyces sp. SL13]|uniref:Fatty acid--CoA ligase family protein n=1 Tax=Streptantibioticus silvisoli TaxID=2705255 RepID=A0AA90H4Y3_9ACTN|nr:fatty acid--CoA ligase family protein [Streptantibioticus silvisoli]MDI5971048.1 fatty acid--CoA ligase family protein [Streptantibioticus silvisoli]